MMTMQPKFSTRNAAGCRLVYSVSILREQPLRLQTKSSSFVQSCRRNCNKCGVSSSKSHSVDSPIHWPHVYERAPSFICFQKTPDSECSTSRMDKSDEGRAGRFASIATLSPSSAGRFWKKKMQS